ncbi:HAD family hydrolase [Intestinibacter sp.]|uniref:HAD family hydrolase n=1 Tax=Intestinibacter sp. TaxID=1965304 RepID=UPI002A75930D|nr:HAD family hydrolase [Intestinibacter sp.]MDY2737546.1 HAD family hydrolase [Intestinibacter sp.]MDY4574057.1 HAD family hydrolase [Intestinibacter sp.]
MTKKFENVDSIIFDLDGTLWDSRKEVAESWSEVLAKYNYNRKSISFQEVNDLMGKTIDEIEDLLFPEIPKEKRTAIMYQSGENEINYLAKHGAKLFDNLEDTLDKLSKKYKLFIVSNCQPGYIEVFLDYYDFNKYFVDHECPKNAETVKSDNIKLIVERNNLKHPVYVGDTQGDANATKDAGLEFVFASYGFGNVEEYQYKIEKIEDLLDL